MDLVWKVDIPQLLLPMEKLKELQICVTGLCTEKDCCPKDTVKTVDADLDDLPCAGCTGCGADSAETDAEEKEDSPEQDQTPH